jgi:subfamily B ATP-binding cassette protein MsbA
MGFGIERRFRGPHHHKPKDPWQALRRCVKWARPHRLIMVVGLFSTLAGVFLGQLPPRIYQYTIDEVITKGQYSLLFPVVALYIGVLLFGQIIGALSGYWMGVAGQRLLHDLRMEVYDHYQNLSLSFYDNKRVGDLLSRVTGDINQLEGMIMNTGNTVIQQVFGMSFALGFMFSYSGTLTLLVLIPVPFLAVGAYYYSRKIRPMYRTIRDRFGELNAKLAENLSGIRVIKAFNREANERALVEDASRNLVDMNVRTSRISTMYYPINALMRNCGLVIVLGVGAWLILTTSSDPNPFTVGALTAFLMYVGHFYSPIEGFIRTYDSILRSLAAGERIFEVLDEDPQVRDPDEPEPLEQVRGAVELRHVSFSYTTGEEVLRDISVHAHPGQRVALVGHSGAGKTSFINLIPRFYDVMEGEVLIDGIDVRAVRQTDLRRHIALVLQETFLFNGTVRENLQFGKQDSNDEEIVAAARAANAHEFIERLSEGYDTQIGERGVKLSGGQKQRLAIARAVLADPRILILDEATSSVDTESEFFIHQALVRLMQGRTTFIIAHRLSTIRSADVILVLENGRIVESGSHNTLYAADGAYAQMYRQQFWLDDLAEQEEEEDAAKQAENAGEFGEIGPVMN